MKYFFLNLIKMIFGIFFVVFGYEAVIELYSIINTEKEISINFLLLTPLMLIFLDFTILTHNLDRILIDKINTYTTGWLNFILIISIISFVISLYGTLINYVHLSEILLFLLMEAFSFALILFSIGYKRILKENP